MFFTAHVTLVIATEDTSGHVHTPRCLILLSSSVKHSVKVFFQCLLFVCQKQIFSFHLALFAIGINADFTVSCLVSDNRWY